VEQVDGFEAGDHARDDPSSSPYAPDPMIVDTWPGRRKASDAVPPPARSAARAGTTPLNAG